MTYSPERIRELMSAMTPAERLAFDAAIRGIKPLFTPNPGPQTDAFNSTADIIGYGGAAGGGKSALVRGLALTAHTRSLLIRQEKTTTKKFVQDIALTLGGRDGYSSQTSTWTFTDPAGEPRVIEFAGLENEGDEEKQQGIDYDLKCVGAGTRVWMADGTKKPVEQVQTGDMVDTLEGPRRVSRAFQRRDNAVMLTTPAGRQVQGVTHRVLTPRGWLEGGRAEELRNPIYLLEDADPQTPTHTPRTWLWPHPYTKEIRTTDRPVRVIPSECCDVGVVSLYDLTVEGANHYITEQGFINKNCYDELTQMREAQVRYTMGWVRTDKPGQRTRVLMTFNPPTTAEGRWVIRFFAPWLDNKHPNPAKDGELRYFATIGDNPDFELPVERGSDPFVIVAGQPVYDFDPGDHDEDDVVYPKSRTFITAKLRDNPYLTQDRDYLRQLQMLPEPLRSQMLKGDFSAGVEDPEWQLLPTAWIEAAMARWQPRDKKGPMDAMGVDAARGGNSGSSLGATGKDKMVIARRHGTWFDNLIAIKGVDVNDGALAAGQVIRFRTDQAPVHIDIVGIGTSPFDFLTKNHIHTIAVNGAAKSLGVDTSGQLQFVNLRAELHWRLREALDPKNPDPIALPDDAELLADLAAPTWSLTPRGIQVEGKEDIKKRIKRSPDKGDAVIYALITTPKLRYTVDGYLGFEAANTSTGAYDDERFKVLQG